MNQARNRSDNIIVIVDDKSYGTISQLAEAYDIGYKVVHARYSRGIRGIDLVDKGNLKIKNVVRDSNNKITKKLTDEGIK